MNAGVVIRFCAMGAMALLSPLWGRTETVEVRILKGADVQTSQVVETRSVELTAQADGALRFTLTKEAIPEDALAVEVVPAFMTASSPAGRAKGGWILGDFGAAGAAIGSVSGAPGNRGRARR